ncbi:MAG TPA: DNA mismatch repair protein MutS, partial [Methanocorpusculum sp.]|nr:DNA mismatch repair protein MutS [Methanocorpusculum sp.]
LVILDEIGRGTSTYDGISIACALVEYLHAHNVKTLFATHYHELNFLEGTLERVKNFHMMVKNLNGNIIFVRKLVPGGTESSFGINVAKLAGMPQSIIKSAEKIMQSLQSGELKLEKKSNEEVAKDETLDKISKFLDDIDVNKLTPIEALNKLNELKVLIKL